MMRGITLSCGCRIQLILLGLPKDFGSLSDVIIDGTMIQPCSDHDPHFQYPFQPSKRETEKVSTSIMEMPDEELVPDSEDIQGREELLKSVKKIRQVLREEGLSKSQEHSVLAFAVRSLLLRWP